MRTIRLFAFACLTVLGLGLAGTAAAQSKNDNSAAGEKAAGKRLTIEVTGGEKNIAVQDASVYVKYEEARTLRKDKKYALNVKTNHVGTAHIRDPPVGRVLIQVVAE